jgi:hypothetical protein
METPKFRTAEQKKKDRKECFDLLPIARGIRPANRFAREVVDLGDSAWAMITTGAMGFPLKRVGRLEHDFQGYFQTFKFEVRFLDLPPRDFVELFAKEKIYPELLKAIKVQAGPAPPPPHPLRRYFGAFWGIYLCRDENDDRTKCAVAFDAFRISALEGNLNSAHVQQLTNAFSTPEAFGTLRVINDTVDIKISFGNGEDPDSFYMASAPKGDVINTLLAISVDIQGGTRLVTTRPALFVRVPKMIKDEEHLPTIHSEDHPLYAVVKGIFDRFVSLNNERFEMVPKAQLDHDSELEIRAAMEALRRDPKNTDRAEEANPVTVV